MGKCWDCDGIGCDTCMTFMDCEQCSEKTQSDLMYGEICCSCFYENRDRNVIIINAMALSGKGTFVELCNEINSNSIELSTVDIVKDVMTYLGWNGVKSEHHRKAMSELKEVLTRWNDIPNKSVINRIRETSAKTIFVNIREPEEIEKMKQRFEDLGYNCYTLLMINDRVFNITSNNSDKNVRNYNYDYEIKNNSSLEDLKEKAEIFLNDITQRSERNE